MATISTSVTAAFTQTVTVTASAATATASSSTKVTPQGGILEGSNPSEYDPKNPVILFIIQVSGASGLCFIIGSGGRLLLPGLLLAPRIREIYFSVEVQKGNEIQFV